MSNKNIVLVGDFYLTLLKSYQSHSIKIWVSELLKNNLLTLFNKPTRATNKSISTIKHINGNFKFKF